MGPNAGDVVNIDGSANSNPYCATINANAIDNGQWYLAVGYVYGSAYPFVSQNLSGVYDPRTGKKVASGTYADFKWTPAVTAAEMRAYCFYGNTASYAPYFARPRFEEVSGTEPSVATLLSPGGILAYLDTADTGQLAPNSATVLFQNNVGNLGSVSVGASGTTAFAAQNNAGPTFDCSVIVTATLSMRQTSGTAGDVTINAYYQDNWSTGAVAYGQSYVVGANTDPVTLRFIFSHLATYTSSQVGLYLSNSGGAATVDVESVVVTTEYIKR